MTCATCRCSPDAVCSISDSNMQAGCPSCSANGTSTASKSLPGIGQVSPSSMTYVKLLPTPKATNNDNRQSLDRYGENLGMALRSILSSEDSPVSPCPTPVNARLRLTIGGSGLRWQESFAHYDPASSSWKTSQDSLLPDSEMSSVTWPARGMWASGSAYELPTWGHLTSESDCSSSALLPTPTTQDGANTGGPSQYDRNSLPLNTLVTTLLPTPTAHEPGGTPEQHLWRKNRLDGGNRVTPTHLSLAVQLLPTPRTTDANGAGDHGNGGMDLRTAVQSLGDPTSQRSEGGKPPLGDPHLHPQTSEAG